MGTSAYAMNFLKTGAFSMGTDARSMRTSAYAMKIDAKSNETDASSMGTCAYSLKTGAFSKGKKRNSIKKGTGGRLKGQKNDYKVTDIMQLVKHKPALLDTVKVPCTNRTRRSHNGHYGQQLPEMLG